MSGSKRKIIFVVGSTASGKSDWSLRWAQEFNGVIFNCDSVQLYRKLDIGAAKPTLAERSLVPHYLFDYVSPPQEMTAGTFRRDFFAEVAKIPEDKPIFVVGGTGFYFMAIEKGMYPVIPIDPELQKAVALEIAEEGGTLRLHRELVENDPSYGAKIHPSDSYRIGRAIELIRTQGRSVTEIQAEFEKAQKPFPFPLLKVGLTWDRQVLKSRIEKRTQKMLNEGLVTEVRGLLEEGLESWGPLSSVGYRETVIFLKDGGKTSDLAEEIAKNTRQLAKRQRTWFQRDSEIHWFAGDTGFESGRSVVEKFLES